MYRSFVLAMLLSLAASVPAVAGSLAGNWLSSSGAVIACDTARCEKVLPNNGMVVDTFDYRLVRGKLALTSLISGLRHEMTVAWQEDGGAVVADDSGKQFRLTPHKGPVPYQNYVVLPSAGLLSDVIAREDRPLRLRDDWPSDLETTAAR